MIWREVRGLKIAGAEARVDLINFSGTTEVMPCYNAASMKFFRSLSSRAKEEEEEDSQGNDRKKSKSKGKGRSRSFAPLRMTNLCGMTERKARTTTRATVILGRA